MKTLAALTMLGVLLMASPAFADVSFQPGVFERRDENGAPIQDGTFTMILDLDGDGWNGNSYLAAPVADNSMSWLWDNDDFLLLQDNNLDSMFTDPTGPISNGTAFPSTILFGDPTQTIPGYNPGDAWYFFWFNTPFNPGAAGPGGGVSYGVEQFKDAQGSFVGAGNNGDTLTPFASLPANATLTTTVIPEPFSAALLLLGGAAMGIRRRFKRDDIVA
jgi:hypothetical protein